MACTVSGGAPRSPATEAMLMILPRSCLSMMRPAVCAQRNVPVKLARHNIQVNAIAPGWFPTHMSQWVLDHKKDYLLSHIPARRFGADHDLKGAAVFLASDASAYVNGHVLVVDGGQSA